MGFKKIVVTDFKAEAKDGTGEISTKATLTLRSPIEAADYKEAKQKVMKVVQLHVISKKRFTVEWKRNGWDEGYLVSL